MYFLFPELVVRHSNYFDFTEPWDLSEGLQSSIDANINLLKQTSFEITCVLRDSELDLIWFLYFHFHLTNMNTKYLKN